MDRHALRRRPFCGAVAAPHWSGALTGGLPGRLAFTDGEGFDELRHYREHVAHDPEIGYIKDG